MSSEPTNESVATWSALTPLPAQVPPPPFTRPARDAPTHRGAPFTRGGAPHMGMPPLPAGVPPFTRGGAPQPPILLQSAPNMGQ